MDETSEGQPRTERTQLRLRSLINELQAGVRENRLTLQALHRKNDMLAERVDDLARQVETLNTTLAEFFNGE